MEPSETAPRGNQNEPPPTNDVAETTNEVVIEQIEESTSRLAVVDDSNHDAEHQDNDDDPEDLGNDDAENGDLVLPADVVARLNRLKELNDERTGIMEEYLKERAALEKKYHTLCEPLFDQRAKIVNGDMDDKIPVSEAVEEPCHGIPQFWVTAMGQIEQLAELISESDVDCLEHLVDVKCVDDEEGGGFTLYFHFEPNDYFHNPVLTKRYEVPNLFTADEPILNNVKGCNIQWKQGRCLTFRQVKKKQRVSSGPNAGKVRTVTRKERQESFFHFFEPPKMPSMNEMDEDEADRIEEAFDQDYDVAQAFRSHIVPKAVLWFTGEAIESEMAEIIDESDWPGGDGANAGNIPFPPPVAGEENPECRQN